MIQPCGRRDGSNRVWCLLNAGARSTDGHQMDLLRTPEVKRWRSSLCSHFWRMMAEKGSNGAGSGELGTAAWPWQWEVTGTGPEEHGRGAFGLRLKSTRAEDTLPDVCGGNRRRSVEQRIDIKNWGAQLPKHYETSETPQSRTSSHQKTNRLFSHSLVTESAFCGSCRITIYNSANRLHHHWLLALFACARM